MYHFQLVTKNYALQLKTETVCNTGSELQVVTRQLVKSNPDMIGMTYRVWANGSLVKEDVISG